MRIQQPYPNIASRPTLSVGIARVMPLSRGVLLGLLLLGGLSGCSSSDFASLFGTQEAAVVPSTQPVVYRGPIYCYDTIGDPNCYAEPFPRPEERFIGAQVDPGFFPGTDPHAGKGSNTFPSN